MFVVWQTAMRVAENNEMCLKLAQENGPVPPVPPATPSKEQEGEKTTPADFCCGDKAQVFTVDAVDVSLDGSWRQDSVVPYLALACTYVEDSGMWKHMLLGFFFCARRLKSCVLAVDIDAVVRR